MSTLVDVYLSPSENWYQDVSRSILWLRPVTYGCNISVCLIPLIFPDGVLSSHPTEYWSSDEVQSYLSRQIERNGLNNPAFWSAWMQSMTWLCMICFTNVSPALQIGSNHSESDGVPSGGPKPISSVHHVLSMMPTHTHTHTPLNTGGQDKCPTRMREWVVDKCAPATRGGRMRKTTMRVSEFWSSELSSELLSLLRMNEIRTKLGKWISSST